MFRRDRLDRLIELESWHFWFVARRERVAGLVVRHSGQARRVLDVGCGSGRLAQAVAPEAADVITIDLHPPPRLAPTRGRVTAETSHLPVRSGAADLVLALDVLEHVDDNAAVAEIKRVLEPGGRLIVTVPAFGWLWSFRDVDAGHLRRYTRATASAVVTRHGFDVVSASYYMATLFPVAAVARLLGRRWSGARDAEEAVPRWLNRLLTGVLRIENRLTTRGVRIPFGTSVVLVAVAR